MLSLRVLNMLVTTSILAYGHVASNCEGALMAHTL